MQDQSFWEDLENSQKQVKRNKEIEDILEDYRDAETGVLDLEVLFEMAQEDESMEKELEKNERIRMESPLNAECQLFWASIPDS